MRKVKRLISYYFDNLPILFFVKNWWVVILGYLGLIDLSPGVFLYLKSGIKFLIVHHLDALVLREIMWDNEYRFLQKKSPMTVIDIGANIGTFSIFAANLNKNNKIYSFEPSPATFSQLRKNLCLNDIDNVTTINAAIFSKRGKLKLYENGMSGQRSLYSVGKSKRYTEVETASLESQIKKFSIQKIDFLKIDREGSEYEILGALKRTTFKMIETIAMEYHELNKNQKREILIDISKRNNFAIEVKPHHIESNTGYIWATKN
jgi:FkbM family methyltransferase